jgi:hypothetical protein
MLLVLTGKYYERERSLHERANMIRSAEKRKSVENAIILYIVQNISYNH